MTKKFKEFRNYQFLKYCLLLTACFYGGTVDGQVIDVEFEAITNQPVTDVFQDERGLIYALPQAEREVLIRYDGHRVVRLGRKEDNAEGLELPNGYEHSLLFKTKNNELLSLSNPTKQVAVIDLDDLQITIYAYAELGFEGDLLSIGFARDEQKWLSIGQLDQRLTVYEWDTSAIYRSFSFIRNKIVEDAKQVAVGDSILLDVYTNGTFLYDWDGKLIKEFGLADFIGASPSGQTPKYSYLAELRYQPDGALYANLRWYYPSLYVYDKKEMVFLPADQPFPSGKDLFVSIPVADSLGNKLYAGGAFYEQRPFMLQTSAGKTFDLQDRLKDAVLGNRFHNDYRPFVANDASKAVWAASETKGIVLIRFPKRRIKYKEKIFGYRNPIAEDSLGIIVSSFEHGIYRVRKTVDFNNRHVWYEGRQAVIRGSKGSHFGEDGRLWCNDREQLFGVDLDNRSAVEIPIPAEIDEAWTLLPGQRALLSVLGGRILEVDLADESVREVSLELFPEFNKIWSIKSVGDSIYLGTDRGFYRGVLGNWQQLKTDLPEALVVYDLYRYLADQWWLATNQGWVEYNPEQHQIGRRYTTDEGLAGNEVRSTVFAKGYFWIGTRSGLSRFDPATSTFRNYSFEEGFTSRKFTIGAAYVPDGNRLFFGTDNGLNYFVPEDLFDDPAPALSISNIQYFSEDDEAVIRNLSNGQSLQHLELPANQRSFEISFFLDDFSNPKEQRYAYRLQGGDSPWIDLKNESRLTFTSLDAGTYQLEIRGRTRYSAWSEPYQLKIVAAEFFYKTWWFRIGGAMLIVGLIGGWIYQLRRERSALEVKVAERTETILADKEVIEQQAAELRELDEAKTRFFANISHELRTPLTVIRGFAEESLDGGAKAEVKQLLGRLGLIKHNSDRLLLLVNQLLELGKLEAGKSAPRYVRTDLRAELDHVLASFQSAAVERDLSLRRTFSFQQLEADLDVDKILKVLYNLVSNALKFTPPGGTVSLTAEVADDGGLEFHVVDDGVGIPEEYLESIFLRFSQVDDGDTRRAEGTGIGLNFARELARVMGGDVTVSSRLGEGSDFCLRLPRWQDQQALPVTQVSNFRDRQIIGLPATVSDLTDEDQRLSSEQPLILLVEDNPDIIAYLKLCLKDYFELLTAMNGQEGLSVALQEVPDLIISDVMMPVMDGLEMCKALKQGKQTSHIPVILLTALSSVKNRIAGWRTGADAYLSKPFAKQELLAQIDNLLARQKRLQQKFAAKGVITSKEEESEEIRKYHEVEQTFLQSVTELIDQRMDDPEFRTEDIAHAVALSQSQLWRKIKALTGLSTSEFVKNYRLNHARDLLDAGELSISQVAYAAGFSDPSYFTKRFTKHFGQTPSQYLATPQDS